MSENVESLRKCTRCCEKLPVEGWGVKPNGELYQYCNACRIDNRAVWHKKPQESKRSCLENSKEKYAYDPEYRKHVDEQAKIRGSRPVICPNCNAEVAHYCLSSHKKTNKCKAGIPVV
jgi:hypothetical protein